MPGILVELLSDLLGGGRGGGGGGQGGPTESASSASEDDSASGSESGSESTDTDAEGADFADLRPARRAADAQRQRGAAPVRPPQRPAARPPPRLQQPAHSEFATVSLGPSPALPPSPQGRHRPAPPEPRGPSGHSRAMELRGADPRGIYHVPMVVGPSVTRHSSGHSIAAGAASETETESGYLAGAESGSDAGLPRRNGTPRWSVSSAPSVPPSPASSSSSARLAAFPIPPDLAYQPAAGDTAGGSPLGDFGLLPPALVHRILDAVAPPPVQSPAPFLALIQASKPLRALAYANLVARRPPLGLAAVIVPPQGGPTGWTALVAGAEVLPDGAVSFGRAGVAVYPFSDGRDGARDAFTQYRARYPVPDPEDEEGERGRGRRELLRILDGGWPFAAAPWRRGPVGGVDGLSPARSSPRPPRPRSASVSRERLVFGGMSPVADLSDSDDDSDASTPTSAASDPSLLFHARRPPSDLLDASPLSETAGTSAWNRPRPRFPSLTSLFGSSDRLPEPTELHLAELFLVLPPRDDPKGKGPPPTPHRFPGAVVRLFRGVPGGHADPVPLGPRADPGLFSRAREPPHALRASLSAAGDVVLHTMPLPSSVRILSAHAHPNLVLRPPVPGIPPPSQLLGKHVASLRRYLSRLQAAGFRLPLMPEETDWLTRTHPRLCADARRGTAKCEACDAARSYVRLRAEEAESARLGIARKEGDAEEELRAAVMRIVGVLRRGGQGGKIVGEEEEDAEEGEREERSRGLLWEAWEGWNGR